MVDHFGGQTWVIFPDMVIIKSVCPCEDSPQFQIQDFKSPHFQAITYDHISRTVWCDIMWQWKILVNFR